MIFLIFLGINPLLDILRRDLKEKWLGLWCQTRSSLLYCPKRSSVDHSLVMFYLKRSDPAASFPTSSKLVDICDELLVRVGRYSPASRLSSWPKIQIFQVSPQGVCLVSSYIVANMGGSEPFWYLTMSFGDIPPTELSLVSTEGYYRTS